MNKSEIIQTIIKSGLIGFFFFHYSRYHPFSLKKRLPYSQLLWTERMCSFEEEFEKQANALYSCF